MTHEEYADLVEAIEMILRAHSRNIFGIELRKDAAFKMADRLIHEILTRGFTITREE